MHIVPRTNGLPADRFLFAEFEPVNRQPQKPQTVTDLVLRYLDHLRVRVVSGEYSARGFADVERDLGRFVKFLKDKPLGQCKRQDLIDWLLANPKWKSNSTKKRNLAEIAACWSWGADEDFLPSGNPYRRPKNLRLRTRRRPDAEPWHYIAFMRKGSKALRRILYYLWNTGCRPCEARELTWDMVHFPESVVIKEDHKTINAQKDPQPRIIGLEPRLVRFLRNLYRQRAKGQLYVFLNVEGGPWTKDGLDQNFRRCRLRLGMSAQVTPYCLRHSYTTEGIEGGVGERQMADQLGHTNTWLIAHYSHAKVKARHLRRVASDVRKRRRDARRSDG
jgi:integrase